MAQQIKDRITKKLHFTRDGIQNVKDVEYAGSFASIQLDNSLNLKSFEESLNFEMVALDENDMELDVSGIDAPMANALRRILIAEVPTMAFDKAVIYQNTSILQDEVLAHRLGLIPVNVDPDLFIDKRVNDDFDEHNSVKFRLHVKCERRPEYANHKYDTLVELPPEQYLTNCTVYSSDLVWQPLGNQANRLKTKPAMLHDKIILAKLRENQEIEIELFCSKGIGRTHAKWSPVSTAYYKLKPSLEFKEDLTEEEGEKLMAVTPAGLIAKNKKTGKYEVDDIWACTMSRECLRDDALNNKIVLGKERNHYRFYVESVGVIRPEKLFTKALGILSQKADHYLKYFSSLD